jgi:hypothetical protein
VKRSPQDEVPAGSVPEPAEQEDHHQVQTGSAAPRSVASERDVDSQVALDRVC